MIIDDSIQFNLPQITAISSLLTWYYNNNSQLSDMYGFDLSDDTSAQIGYNAQYGNTYLSSELLPFTPYISDFDDGVKLLVSNPDNGNETTISQCHNQYRQILAADKTAARVNR